MPDKFSEITQILGQYKDTIGLILTGLAGSVTHVLNKSRKGEKLTIYQHIIHLFISGFAGYLIYLICQFFNINGPLLGFIIGVGSYSGIQIIDAIDMIKARTIYNVFLDFLKYKLGKK